MPKRGLIPLLLAAALAAGTAWAGAQQYEPLSASVRSQMSKSVSDAAVEAAFAEQPQVKAWLAETTRRLARYIPDAVYREDFLRTLHYEATRAGLDPELLLGLIEVESGFRKYAISEASARGYMQVMPFWTKLIGTPEHNLFHLRTNLRYGCTILRHYLDIEQGDLYRALGRYNGSLGQPQYPNAVHAAWRKRWTTGIDLAATPPRQAQALAAGRGG